MKPSNHFRFRSQTARSSATRPLTPPADSPFQRRLDRPWQARNGRAQEPKEPSREPSASAIPEAGQALTPVDRDLIELVRRALIQPKGDGHARAKLCDRLLPLFHSIGAKLCYRFRGLTRETIRQESLDIVQHISCAFLEDLNLKEGVVARWRADQGPLEAWLRPFATCRALDHLRKRKRPLSQLLHPESLQTALEEDLLSLHAGRSSADEQIEQRDALQKLCRLIVSDPELGPDTLKLLERLFWLEEDRELLAASLGLKRNTLDVRLKRIREQLVKLAQRVGLPFGCTRDSGKSKKKQTD